MTSTRIPSLQRMSLDGSSTESLRVSEFSSPLAADVYSHAFIVISMINSSVGAAEGLLGHISLNHH